MKRCKGCYILLFIVGFICFTELLYGQSEDCDLNNELSITIDDLSANQGDCLCVPFRAYNFNMIAATQIGICWDESILEYKVLNDSALGASIINLVNINIGELTYIWIDNTGINPVTLDGGILFEICFDVIGQCNSTEIELNCIPNFSTEISNSEGAVVEACLDNGLITVSCTPECLANNGTIRIQSN